MTGNAYYPTTNPTLAAVQTQLDALDTALKMPLGQARDGAVATARPPLEETLQDLAENLEQATPGNLQKLSTTGYDLRKTPKQTSEPPATPANLRLKNLPESGAVQFLFDASERAKSYQFQTTDDPNGGGVEGLRSGEQYAERRGPGPSAGERCLGPRPCDRTEQYQERLE